MTDRRFSLARVLAIFIKEVQQMLRDRPTFAMAVGVPILQLLLFGYAINTDPKGLPTAVVTQDRGPMARGRPMGFQAWLTVAPCRSLDDMGAMPCQRCRIKSCCSMMGAE